ncbi:N-acetylglucosamine-6-phosphate deacetylase [Bacillus methanolicus]|uniref:N-acetylglucosamine-6-phosphate deacetylase n=1 Tax=Bacillus methanolicus TaxID=1471 RepID=UPI00200E0C30|nr:N-acetylglucosamine-6-phosphate deacetylase [Bacillus methanolicus]UQD53357.1 N-acetylglucosamine-6-phosphate deacetylase [Bacillus methanolicus]
MKKTLLKNIEIYTGEEVIDNGYLLFKDDKILDIGLMKDLVVPENTEEINLEPSFKAAPGFIDLHIHGAGGADTMDATTEALSTMAGILPAEGTTSFLASTITQEITSIEVALKNVANYRKHHNLAGEAEILGIHLEGPFINAKRAGAQPIKHILEPDIDLFKHWQKLAENGIKLVTMAPEQKNGLEFVRYLNQSGVITSIGHSDATYEETIKAVEAGAKHVTHLFNGMRGLHHREPGIAGAALLLKELMVEIIADGIHVRPEMIQLSLRSKGIDRMILITDSMRAKCLKNGTYDLGGQDVAVKDGIALLENGTLAGSILKMKDSFKNMMKFTGISLVDAIQMASINPAKQINVYDRKGSLAPGKDADIVILDDNYEVFMTFCRGKIAYKRGGENQQNEYFESG